MPGPVLTHWTIRLALICLVICLAGRLRWGDSPRWFAWSRWIWTFGCLLFLAHVASAFQFYHHWSHAKAFQSTAEQTGELLGVRFGEGIYFSYLFTLLWVADVLWQWALPDSYRRRPVWLAAGLLSFLTFIAFNGAVIFEDGVTRWVGVPVTLALLLAWLAMLLRARSPDVQKSTSRSLFPGR